MTDLAPKPAPNPAPPTATDFETLVRRAIVVSIHRLRRAAHRSAGNDRRHVALDRWFAGFAAEVRGHLELAQSGLLPMLAARGALDERALDAIAADHGWVDHLLGELGDALGVLAFAFGDEATWSARSATIADELDLVVGGVLAREVRLLVPLALSYLDADERAELERIRRRDLVVHRAPFSLAWLGETLGDATEARILAGVPGPVRLMMRTRRRAYARTVDAALA